MGLGLRRKLLLPELHPYRLESDGSLYEKNIIYVRMLALSLPYIRNIQTWDEKTKGKDRSCYFEVELIHNLTVTLLESEFFDHDIWFLNRQARSYLENCSDEISPNYHEHLKCIKALFELVPDALRPKLLWPGP